MADRDNNVDFSSILRPPGLTTDEKAIRAAEAIKELAQDWSVPRERTLELLELLKKEVEKLIDET